MPTQPPLYVVLHLYKTAGKTLLRHFENNMRGRGFVRMYSSRIGLDKADTGANPGWDETRVLEYLNVKLRPDTRCLFGHMAFYGVHELPQAAGRDVRYIVFLREPAARIISLYNYLRGHSTNAWHQEIVEHQWSLAEWFRHSSGLWLRNGQLRQLLLWSHKEVLHERHLTREHLEAGKKALEAMWFIGTTETFAADLVYLSQAMAFQDVAYDAVANASSGEKQIDPHLLTQIREENALDIELYDYGCARRRQRLEMRPVRGQVAGAGQTIGARLRAVLGR
jgi:hypothetical protein